METVIQTTDELKHTVPKRNRWQQVRTRMWKDRYLYLLLLPGLLYFLIYRYLPMLGITIAFKNFSPFMGIADSPWVGLDNFRRIFENPEVLQVIWNTLVISFLQIAFAFPAPILLAIMLNEVANPLLKRLMQSVVYMPHFLSWVVVVGIVTIFFRNEGLVNDALRELFGVQQSIGFLTEPDYFRLFLVFEVIWKEAGWGTIIFLAALAGVNPALYEAAVMDGASRFRQIWHITLPAIRSTIIIMLIIRLGDVLEVGFEQVFLQLNAFNMQIGNTLDTYVYYKGIQQSDYSFSTAVGVFKGLVGLVLVMCANKLSKRFGEQGVY
ncbi:carbohydrate ABC transporter membrane protein 1, CUT1 family (TC 3.A.1.1.-) [Paenibacillus uliginis N3/975]|uniref:Carbohydrate ABC transporter membrane protein 1, CUT1 family (TC 3.A.1.1.-) n=1 Tax=Paenibacillus uliginis N3/975 TaxID=1313296 RepID=A0A1X7HBX7_9BACL|nr:MULTISPECIES: ABC transporter permease subunit [Paenibacillus]UNK16443.1 ABC transporter permease subunit [Paenibacillus sp. N3/727]SMF83068.1 carbohydrate ABC transporter membrane protein 1, CUT1 family (TC 3.A.1.1.-) [Paenibacillus uliginis N3/975]